MRLPWVPALLGLALLCAGSWFGSTLDPDLLLYAFWRLLERRSLDAFRNESLATDMQRGRCGPLPDTVYGRGLVNRRVRASSILDEHQAFFHNTSKRAFGGTVVGFVSPWAERSDETVWRFSRKLTHLSPVLFEAKQGGGVHSTIGDEAGRQWLRWVRSASKSTLDVQAPPPKLMPLVSLERLDLAEFFGAAEDAELRAGQLLVSLQTLLLRAKLDGFVLHAHGHLARLDTQERRRVQPKLHLFVQLLAAQLSQEGGELMLLVPPHPGLFSATEFEQLHEALGGVILATANYSAVKGAPGPSAPISWMKRSLAELSVSEAAVSKLVATLPMVGWDFTAWPDSADSSAAAGPKLHATPLSASSYLAALRRHDGWLEWDAAGAEHALKYSADGVDHALYYASLRGIAERLGVLRQLNVGAAIWELGTTLDYFFDLL